VNSTLFLRIASILSLIHCTLHTVGGVFGKPKHGAEEVALVDSLKSHMWDFMGSMRSYWDFLFGYGLALTITLFVQFVLFWQLSGIVKKNPELVKPIILLFFFNCVLTAIVSWKYFFAGPGITQLLIAAALAVAYFLARSTAAA
jgi:hypothetical protein